MCACHRATECDHLLCGMGLPCHRPSILIMRKLLQRGPQSYPGITSVCGSAQTRALPSLVGVPGSHGAGWDRSPLNCVYRAIVQEAAADCPRSCCSSARAKLPILCPRPRQSCALWASAQDSHLYCSTPRNSSRPFHQLADSHVPLGSPFCLS